MEGRGFGAFITYSIELGGCGGTSIAIVCKQVGWDLVRDEHLHQILQKEKYVSLMRTKFFARYDVSVSNHRRAKGFPTLCLLSAASTPCHNTCLSPAYVMPKVMPKVMPELMPKVVPEVVPKIMAEVMPKVIPKVMPTVIAKWRWQRQ